MSNPHLTAIDLRVERLHSVYALLDEQGLYGVQNGNGDWSVNVYRSATCQVNWATGLS